MIAAAKIDPRKYGRLLARTLPTVIETEEDNERILAEIHKLMLKGDSLSPEEEVLLELMSKLVETFEKEHYPIEPAPPHEILRMLMDDRGLRQRDLLEVFKSSGIASEVINGKRNISKAQALALGKFFNVSPQLFLWGIREPEQCERPIIPKREASAHVVGKQMHLPLGPDEYEYGGSTRVTIDRPYISRRQREPSQTQASLACAVYIERLSGLIVEIMNGNAAFTPLSLTA